MPTNDNGILSTPTDFAPRDPYGHAALLLVESLIHGLREKSLLSTADAIEIVETATNVGFDLAEAADGAGAPLWRSHALLLSIAASLGIDADDTPPQPRLVT